MQTKYWKNNSIEEKKSFGFIIKYNYHMNNKLFGCQCPLVPQFDGYLFINISCHSERTNLAVCTEIFVRVGTEFIKS